MATNVTKQDGTSHLAKQVKEKTSEEVINQKQADNHPRHKLPVWKWRGTVAAIYLTAIINGYDVSNVANIQPQLYRAFGHIDLLPWIGLSYSLANFAVLSLARKMLYCIDMRWVWIANLLVFVAGAAVSGSAGSIEAVIVGRVIMGVGGAIVMQCNTSFFAVFATPAETPGLFGAMSGLWAIGLVVGGPIGSALAENPAATWRWAFYMNLPFVGLALLLTIICVPNHSLAPSVPLKTKLLQSDSLGIALHIASAVLFAVAATFSGPVWEWGSSACVTVWAVFGLVFVSWGLQQVFCVGTNPEQRAFPVHMLSRLDLLPLWIATACAGASYAVTLYYTPLYFAFARGFGALEQTVRILPFILVFIIMVVLAGGSLPKHGRYSLLFILGGAITLAGGAAMVVTLKTGVSQSQVMGLEALIGVGLGLHFQHGIGISNVILKSQRDRVDSVVLFNMAQMGGIAIALSIAGSIYQNVGYSLLTAALGDEKYSEHDLREALAGVSSRVWQSKDPEVLRRGVEAVTKVIAREFYLVVAGGALCLVCGMLMKWERLDYGKKKTEETVAV
ncbi:hypothetical protein G7046_g6105 [Stylonectria norvegica]|nr:hypothetical protein G7046_g6105 [Stylonectria norvegica]